MLMMQSFVVEHRAFKFQQGICLRLTGKWFTQVLAAGSPSLHSLRRTKLHWRATIVNVACEDQLLLVSYNQESNDVVQCCQELVEAKLCCGYIQLDQP